jgi:streptogramin lyase
MIGARPRQPATTRLALALLLALTLLIPALGTPAPALAAPQIDYYSYDLADMFVLGGFTAGPDGAHWFTNSNGSTASQIGRLNADGTISALASYSPGILMDLALGPDGNLWATARHFYNAADRIDHIVRITPQLVITSYPLPNPNSAPERIVAGPDGALWFTESASNRIGRITTSGAITEYPLPTPASAPTGIATGADGALWFTEKAGNRIARITTTGTITEFPPLEPDSAPTHIATGPDGRVWFSDKPHRRLGAIATDGTLTYYPLTIPPPIYGNPANAGPEALTIGPDGNLWVIVQQTHQIWRVSTSGDVLAKIGLPFPDRPLINIAPGPDGRVWYGKIGRIGAITPVGQVTQWQYGTDERTAILPTESGSILLIRQRNFGAPKPRLERISPNGFIERLPIAEFPEGSLIANPVLGPDDAIWCFVVPNGAGSTAFALGQIAADGTLTTTPITFGVYRPGPPIFGPDGNLWFILYGPGIGSGQYAEPYNLIARLTLGGQLTTFPVEDAYGIDSALPATDLTVGPDGNLWFIGPRSNQIHRITPAGQITPFTIPSGANQYLSLGLLARGPDGHLWFSAYISRGQSNYDRTLGKLAPDGRVTFFPLTGPTEPGYSGVPTSLLAGPDGNLWFTTESHAVFHSITPDGKIIDFWLDANANRHASGFIAATADSLWFIGSGIGRLHLPATSTLTTRASGNGTVSPGGTYPTGQDRPASAAPGAGSTLVGWRVDGIYRGWPQTLSVTVLGPTTAEAIFLPTASFADLPGADPTAVAARELATRGIMDPLPPARCQQLGLAAPCFGATDTLDRTQGTLMLARSIPAIQQEPSPNGPGIGPRTWRDIPGPSSPFTDRCPENQSCVPTDEWQTISLLRFFGVTLGYGDRTFGAHDPLLNVQTVALISRAMVEKGYWQPQQAAPGLFAGSVPAVHADDVATYLHYVGSLPDAPGASAAWGGWLQPSTRGWFARALWAALDRHWGAGTP